MIWMSSIISETSTMRRSGLTIFSAVAALCILVVTVEEVGSQPAYPDRPVRIISGLLAGTSGDVAGRLLAEKLTQVLGQPFVFENRPGANGQIAARAVKAAKPDGSTLLLTASSTMVTASLTNASVGYDSQSDFTAIAQVVAAPLFLAVSADLGVNTTREFVAYAKSHPGTLSYGSVGRGSVHHFQAEAFNLAAGIDMTHIPYAASNMGNMVGDLIANRLQVLFIAYTSVPAAVASGRVKVLGVFSERRIALMPDLPTVDEEVAGLRVVPSWFGLFGSAGLDSEITATLEKSTQGVVNDPSVRQRLNELGLVPLGGSGTAMANEIRMQHERMATLARKMGVRPE